MSVHDIQDAISAEFTAEVLRNIVIKKSGLTEVKVTKITLGAPSKKGDSYLSTVMRFIVDATGKNTNGKEENVRIPMIVKGLPANLGRRKTYRSTDFFENEVIFYEKVWTALKEFQSSKNVKDPFNNIPEVLHAHIDGVNDFVAMIDLSYDGYKSPQRGNGLDYDHTVAILKLFAGFHGLALAFKHQEGHLFEQAASSLKETYFAEKYRNWYERFQFTLFEIVCDAVEKELPENYLDRVHNLIDNDLYGKLCESCENRGPLAVITHGDTWAPNFLTKYENSKPQKVVMIDFQLTRYTTLSNDLTFFLFSNVDLSLLDTHWDEFIEIYHKELVQVIQKYGSPPDLVTLKDLQEDIKNHMAFGVGMSMEAMIMSLLDEDEVSDLDAIQGDEAVPLETVWVVHPFKNKEKRQKMAAMIKLAVDKKFI